jgi:Fur family ferric uptake transcriptional regulator
MKLTNMSKKEFKEETEIFTSFLRQKGLKKTYQKDLILETFLNTDGHLSVDDIYALVKKRDRKVGIVTVFRTLRSIAECGLAREISLGDGLKRFEHSHKHPPHHHIVCTGCHKVIEYASPELDELQNKVLGRYDVQLHRHSFQSFGLCEDCRTQRPAVESRTLDSQRLLERDSIQLSLRMAAKSLEFFQDLVRRNQDPDGRAVSLQAVRKEESRISDLNCRLQDLIRHDKQIEHAPLFLHYDESDLDGLIPDLSSYEKDGRIQLNHSSIEDLEKRLADAIGRFFSEYAGMFPQTAGKQILLNFAQREESREGAAALNSGKPAPVEGRAAKT